MSYVHLFTNRRLESAILLVGLLLCLGGLVALLLLGVFVTDAWAVGEVSAASVAVDVAEETPPCGEVHGPETCHWQLGLRDDAFLRFEEGCEIGITVLADNALYIECGP